jgi:hypothetical protein
MNIKQRFGKKSQAQYLLENTFRIMFMTIALLAFFLLIILYINNKIDARLVQAETLSYRILYSDAIMYRDPDTFRAYAGIVDAEKFVDGDKNLEKSIPYTFQRHAAAKVVLYNKPIAGQQTFIAEAYLNKDQWYNWKQLINSVTGKGSASLLIKKFPVTCMYKSTGQFDYCTLDVEVIVPNS